MEYKIFLRIIMKNTVCKTEHEVKLKAVMKRGNFICSLHLFSWNGLYSPFHFYLSSSLHIECFLILKMKMQNLIVYSIFSYQCNSLWQRFFQDWNSLTTPLAIYLLSHLQRLTSISDLYPSLSTLSLERNISSENLLHYYCASSVF